MIRIFTDKKQLVRHPQIYPSFIRYIRVQQLFQAQIQRRARNVDVSVPF